MTTKLSENKDVISEKELIEQYYSTADYDHEFRRRYDHVRLQQLYLLSFDVSQ